MQQDDIIQISCSQLSVCLSAFHRPTLSSPARLAMLSSVSGFINRRRRGLTVLASLAGGAYLLTSYARQRFAELTERLTIDRAAKEKWVLSSSQVA